MVDDFVLSQRTAPVHCHDQSVLESGGFTIGKGSESGRYRDLAVAMAEASVSGQSAECGDIEHVVTLHLPAKVPPAQSHSGHVVPACFDHAVCGSR